MLISHKGHTDTIHVYSVTVMTHVKALQAGHSSQGTSEPITPVRGRYGPARGAVPISYCMVMVCERVHAVWITYFGVAIYILVQQ